MLETIREFFSIEDFMPHGHCYLWKPALVRLHLVSDVLIALSYTSIPFTLAYFVRKRRDLPFSWMFLCFGLFIISCGMTHVMEIVTLYRAQYWWAGAVKAVTAAASVTTAILLVRLMPQALALPSPSQHKAYADELERRNRELKEVGYSVAHDLRAPARAVVSFSDCILKKAPPLDEETRGHFQRVIGAGRRLSLMLDGLLSLTQVSQRKPVDETVDLSALARQRVEELSAQEPGRKFDLTAPARLPARGDPRLLAMLVQNLIDNAWKFTRDAESAEIEVGVEERGGAPLYFVRDNGRGFDVAIAGRLFRPFHRLPNSSDLPGLGIGLASAARVVDAHGGRIWAESRPQKGATFFFRLAPD
jgi:signal transduction histidine kinase